MERTTARASAIAFTLAALIIALTVRTAFAQLSPTACPAGSTPITSDADRAAARIAGIPNSSNCWQKQDQNVGAGAAQAKQYLRSIVCKGSAFGGTTADGTIEGLDANFAQCAAKFLKAMSSQLPGQVALLDGGTSAVCVREGYRTVAQQEKYAQEYRNGGGIACTKGALCEHPRGIAIDANTATDQGYQTMWAQGPSYGVNFYLTSRDKVHFVPMKAGCTGGGFTPQPGVNNGSGTSVSTGSSVPTGGNVNGSNPNALLPASYYDYPQYAPAAAGAAPSLSPFLTPLSGFTQQATTPVQSTQTTIPNTTQTTPNYQNLFPNSQINPTPTDTGAYTPYTSGTSSPSGSGQSAADQIANFASSTNAGGTGSAGSVQSGTSSPTQLNNDLNDVVSDAGPLAENSNTSNNIAMNTVAPNSVAVAPVLVPSTFNSSSGSVQQQPVAPQNSTDQGASIVRTVLVALRDLLTSYLQFLQSHANSVFKGPWQPTQPAQIAD